MVYSSLCSQQISSTVTIVQQYTKSYSKRSTFSTNTNFIHQEMAGIHPRGRGSVRGRGHHFNPLEMWESKHGQFGSSSYITPNPETGRFKLHVRSIPRNYTKTTLLNIFKKVSTRASVLYFHPAPPGSSFTWAFVEYPSFKEALSAIQFLNNNLVVDNIEIAFAKEKAPDYHTDYFDFGPEEEEEEPPLAHLNHSETSSSIPVIDPKSIKMTVRNDKALQVTRVLDNYFMREITPENLKRMEENLFQKILKMHKEDAVSGKCIQCGARTALACSVTCGTFYCSEDCQAKDWPRHSESCKTSNESSSSTDMRAGGDSTLYTNGHGAVQSERERNNKFGAKIQVDDQYNFNKSSSSRSESPGRFDKGRFNTDQARGRNSDWQSNANSGQGFNREQRRGRNNDQQNDSTSGQRNMFEERKARLANQNQACSDNSADKRHQNVKKNVPVQPPSDWHVPTQALRRQAAPTKSEEKLTTGSEFIFKEREFLSKPEDPKPNPSPSPPTVVGQSTVSAPTSTVVAPGLTVASAPLLLPANVFTEVFVHHRAGKSLAVTPVERLSHLIQLMDSIQCCEFFSAPSSHALKPGFRCLVLLPCSNKWYRGKIFMLEPLSVWLVDYGNIEEVSIDNIKELPESFAKEPPFVVNVKPKDEISEQFTKEDFFSVKPLYKENVWIVEVAPAAASESITPLSTSNGAKILVNKPNIKPTELNKPIIEPTKLNKPTIETTEFNKPTIETTELPEPLQPAASPSQTVSSSTSNSVIALKQQVSTEFPKLLKADCYSTVTITLPVSADSYCVGESNIFNAIMEIDQYCLSSHCSSITLTPTLGALGIALFEGNWYRVKVVCMEPLSVKYIDYGNVDLISPNDLKTCPVAYIEVPPLVCQITLAPGTPKEFFNLPEGSELSVKPITKLPDETISVQIEGQSYETEITSLTMDGLSKSESSSGQSTNQDILPQVPDSHQQTPTQDKIAELQFSVDKLQEGWTARFMPTHLELSRNSLHGYLYSEMIQSTFELMCHFDEVMEAEVHDPAYQVQEGEVVGCKQDNVWYRVQRCSEQLSVFIDMGLVDQSVGDYFKLPDRFSTTAVPLLAAEMTIDNNKQLLRDLKEIPEVLLSVVEVSEQEVKVILQESGVCGQLKRWSYDPLVVPDPLGPSTLVTICRVMQSNTFMVRPANDIKALQIIQIECRKNAGKQLQSTPKVGDHVAYFLKEDDMFCRSRIVQIYTDKDEYELFNIDLGTKVLAKLAELNPLSDTLRKLSCRATLVELKDVVLTEMTPEAKLYICSLVENEKILRIEYEPIWNTATLIQDEGGENVNSTLNQLLNPVINPDNFGKYMLDSIQESNPLRNQDLKVVVTQTEPLYVQLLDHSASVEELHNQIQEHCANDKNPYKPCTLEVCLVNYAEEWYRSVCVLETPTGVCAHQLLDFGNITEVSADQVRRIHPDMLKLPIIGIACKINGLPSYEDCSKELQARLDSLLPVYSCHTVTFETEATPDNTHFIINIPEVLATLKSEGLI